MRIRFGVHWNTLIAPFSVDFKDGFDFKSLIWAFANRAYLPFPVQSKRLGAASPDVRAGFRPICSPQN
jgi:hypothetical protein